GTGQCPGCREGNTLVETSFARGPAGAAAGGSGRRRSATGKAPRPVPLREVDGEAGARHATGIAELDRVLGGGLVPGSVVLLGGPPGIGKSTLTAMALGNLAAQSNVLYVTGEESAAQVRLRAERLGEAALAVPVLAENALAPVLAAIESERPAVCVIDSIQTLTGTESTGAPGSVGQVRECTTALMELGKRLGTAIVLVGHVTKDGSVAGPRVLEHLVDCVLLFEGERERSYRTVRALKNRFGATNEVGVFEMRSGGLTEVEDPSARLVGESTVAPGSCVLCGMEGTRPLLVEVQALVSPTEVDPPRRVVSGVDRNRLAMIIAVLSRYGGLRLGAADVFVNVAGGVRLEEPGADLAIALALASASSGKALSAGGTRVGAFGELALSGELREVAHPDRRMAEASKFGLAPVIGPRGSEPVDGLTGETSLADALRISATASAPRSDEVSRAA
ncbi:MAG: DNA repair protein RadA, partial [Solirubrobacterales bacterium]